jgi:hypothetical protein
MPKNYKQSLPEDDQLIKDEKKSSAIDFINAYKSGFQDGADLIADKPIKWKDLAKQCSIAFKKRFFAKFKN